MAHLLCQLAGPRADTGPPTRRTVRGGQIHAMDLIFLGTSSGTPTKQRNVTGLALAADSGKAWYLVDCGEATQHQLLHTPLSLNGLRAIFITHVHGDHCYGLPGLLASAAMAGRKDPLPIVAPKGIEAWIRATLELTAVFLPFALEFIPWKASTFGRTANGRLPACPCHTACPRMPTASPN